MSEYYQGKVVPEMVQADGDMNCDNSYCVTVRCEDCINFPSIETDVLKHDYLNERRYDVNIYKSPT